ncbi:MAG: phage tail tape measure protein, partial [candidate division SR1 bacterium]
MSDADYRLKVALDAVNEIDESKIRKEMESIGKKGGKAMSDGLDQESKKGADKVIKNMEGIEKKGNIFTKLGHKIKTAFTGASNAIRGLVASIPVIGQILAVLGLVVTALKGVGDKISHSMDVAREFEDAFAGIRKTVDESETNLRKLEKAVVALSTEIPMTVQELSKIAELGGQLGVPADKLIDFTKTVAMLGVTTNLTSEDAATAFAKIANNTKEPLENIDRMGASVVALGNNFATTESDIVAFANNIASRGAIVGMSTDQIFAIATAFSSVGMEAEAGGTAVSKVISRLSEAVLTGGGSLEAFARVSGSSAQEFAELWSNDPGEAFSNFVAGLGTAGTDAMIILKELELTDERLQKAFLSLANNSDLLTNAIDLSSEARKNNSALQD